MSAAGPLGVGDLNHPFYYNLEGEHSPQYNAHSLPEVQAEISEYVPVPEFGEHEKCEDCEHALQCMSGSFEYLQVATTRAEQREGKSLPCVDDGKVRLKVLTREEYFGEDAPFTLPVGNGNAGTVIEVSDGTGPMTTDTIQISMGDDSVSFSTTAGSVSLEQAYTQGDTLKVG